MIQMTKPFLPETNNSEETRVDTDLRLTTKRSKVGLQGIALTRISHAIIATNKDTYKKTASNDKGKVSSKDNQIIM